MESWGGGSVGGYSVRVLRAVLRMREFRLSRLRDWVVANSLKYGVVIGFEMGDYVVLLVGLCLKAVVKEGEFVFGEKGIEMGMERSFECPVLDEVLVWLGMQFAVLYGEANGRLFAAGVVKEAVMESAVEACLFPLDGERRESSCVEGGSNGEVDGNVERGGECVSENVGCQTVGNSVISVSQVAEAVAALHERAILEENIRALRDPRTLSAYQRNMEHAYISKAADEERQKRPNYRPIIEHDGLLWQQSRDQETNKVKTREELLAEERDYKRRRMSYRGKKLKRNGVEVLRDIIDEYMEEIKQSGGLDSMPNVMKDAEVYVCNSLHGHESSSDFSASRRSYSFNRELNSRHRSEYFEDDIQTGRQEPNLDQGLLDSNGNNERAKHDRNDYSRKHSGEKRNNAEAFKDGSSSRRLDQRGSKSRERDYDKRERDEHAHNSHRRERDEHERNYDKRERDEHERNYDKRERDEHKRNSYERKRSEDSRKYRDRGRSRTKQDCRESDGEDAEYRDRRRSKRSRSNSSFTKIHDEFDDRYNPAEPHDYYYEHDY